MGFRTDSALHKEMLAILAALTDVIKERGGSQSSTEYFLALVMRFLLACERLVIGIFLYFQMETLDAANEDSEVIASVSLLAMGIKTVPEAVLRKKFGDTANLLMDLMKRFADTEHQNILRNVSFV